MCERLLKVADEGTQWKLLHVKGWEDPQEIDYVHYLQMIKSWEDLLSILYMQQK